MVKSLAAGSALELASGDVHVWRVRLSAGDPVALWDVLSPDERTRAERFFFREHRDAWVVARGMLRRILGGYALAPARELAFVTGEFGKPALRDHDDVRFNLSHSGDIALVAVARGRDVGVDVERWNERTEYFQVADLVFSVTERAALRALDDDARAAGFFTAWSRKEAYIKASGHGITRGLDHFDVTLRPGEPAAVVEDRLEPGSGRWVMRDVAVPDGYSAAVVAAAPVERVALIDAA